MTIDYTIDFLTIDFSGQILTSLEIVLDVQIDVDFCIAAFPGDSLFCTSGAQSPFSHNAEPRCVKESTCSKFLF